MNPDKTPSPLAKLFKQRREELGFSQQQVADGVTRALGGTERPLTQQSYASFESGRSQTNRHSAHIASFLGLPLDVVTHADAALGKAGATPLEAGPVFTRPWQSVQIKGCAQLGPDGYWEALSADDGCVDVPSSDPDAYALRVKGDSMMPAIRSGWVVWCEPNRELVPSEYVMVRTTDGQCMVKELLYINDREVSLMAVNGNYGRLTIPAEQVEQIHHVGGIVAPSKIRY